MTDCFVGQMELLKNENVNTDNQVSGEENCANNT